MFIAKAERWKPAENIKAPDCLANASGN